MPNLTDTEFQEVLNSLEVECEYTYSEGYVMASASRKKIDIRVSYDFDCSLLEIDEFFKEEDELQLTQGQEEQIKNLLEVEKSRTEGQHFDPRESGIYSHGY